jgi:predicted  nucleic acid-binding Zn-ribbon protein
MLDVIEKLLILQDRDRALLRARAELASIEPERIAAQARTASSQTELDAAKLKAKQIETERKELELEVEAKKLQIDRYASQQLQTRKNEEYRALAHEIETCRKIIAQVEDKQLELMEQAENLQQDLARIAQRNAETQRMAREQLATLTAKEENLRQDLGRLESDREALASAVDPEARGPYQRLLKQKGETALVGIAHSVCGGCHMKLPPQVLLSCQSAKELVYCPNCGRLLYFTRDMDLMAAE